MGEQRSALSFSIFSAITILSDARDLLQEKHRLLVLAERGLRVWEVEKHRRMTQEAPRGSVKENVGGPERCHEITDELTTVDRDFFTL